MSGFIRFAFAAPDDLPAPIPPAMGGPAPPAATPGGDAEGAAAAGGADGDNPASGGLYGASGPDGVNVINSLAEPAETAPLP
ncbi:hypothetical protein [Mycobacterium sp. SP-6446]|uniref:hypothetical protein n=1 Tax=Mycobacterium sp. SP-6446 TaxID=1834162 RepID=UPI00096E99DE|nr:hypothetical protein [Mycobacterium sp. SP-6446]OMC13507.1 hypothetical protein A5736_22910 [Mycobacterium sp. SP-6446]